MKTITAIAAEVKMSQPGLSNIINRKRKPSWPLAKVIAEVTGTTPELWLDGSKKEIKAALNGQPTNQDCP